MLVVYSIINVNNAEINHHDDQTFFMLLLTKRITLLLAILYFSFSGNTAHAQKGLKGIYAINSVSRVPVQDALLQSEDLRFAASADENGFINLKALPASVNGLTISRIGFEPKKFALDSIVILNNSAVVYLLPKVASLQEVTVNATAGSGVFKTISDLDIHLRPINNSQEILRMVPGLFIGQHAGGGKSEQIFLRGFDIDHGTDINLDG